MKLLCVYMCEMPACSEILPTDMWSGMCFIPEKDLCDGSRGCPSPLDWTFDQGTQGTAQSHAPLFHPLALAAGSPLFPLLLSRVISKVILIMKAGSGFFSTVKCAFNQTL